MEKSVIEKDAAPSESGTASGHATTMETALSPTCEAATVLRAYLELIANRQLKHQLAPASVLDWFGRSIRGPLKINEFLRRELNEKYHAEFEAPQECGPIESKPSHIIKDRPEKERDYIHHTNKVVNAPSLRTRAESDVEDEVHSVSDREEACPIANMTPPASAVKGEGDRILPASCGFSTEEEFDSEEEVEDQIPKTKKLKLAASEPFHYLKRWPKKDMYTSDHSRPSKSEADEVPPHKSVDSSPLNYVEVKGVFTSSEQHTRHEHQTNTSSWERSVRLKLAYRRHKSNQEIQFVLVIYENLNPELAHVPRNLMSEFANAMTSAADEWDVQGDAYFSTISGQTESAGRELTTTTLLDSDGEAGSSESGMLYMKTPIRTPQTPPPTPKRRQRLPEPRRFQLNPDVDSSNKPTPKRPSVARSLRL